MYNTILIIHNIFTINIRIMNGYIKLYKTTRNDR